MAVKMNSFILSLLLVVALAIGAASSPANEVEIAPPTITKVENGYSISGTLTVTESNPFVAIEFSFVDEDTLSWNVLKLDGPSSNSIMSSAEWCRGGTYVKDPIGITVNLLDSTLDATIMETAGVHHIINPSGSFDHDYFSTSGWYTTFGPAIVMEGSTENDQGQSIEVFTYTDALFENYNFGNKDKGTWVYHHLNLSMYILETYIRNPFQCNLDYNLTIAGEYAYLLNGYAYAGGSYW